MTWRREQQNRATCPECGTVFTMQNYNQKFCSAKCRNAVHNRAKADAIDFWRKHGPKGGEE